MKVFPASYTERKTVRLEIRITVRLPETGLRQGAICLSVFSMGNGVNLRQFFKSGNSFTEICSLKNQEQKKLETRNHMISNFQSINI